MAVLTPMATLRGTIKMQRPKLRATLQAVPTLRGTVSTVIAVTDLVEIYDGVLEITPKAFADQTLETKGKLMDDDITVFAIPYSETTNTSDGLTVYIG